MSKISAPDPVLTSPHTQAKPDEGTGTARMGRAGSAGGLTVSSVSLLSLLLCFTSRYLLCQLPLQTIFGPIPPTRAKAPLGVRWHPSHPGELAPVLGLPVRVIHVYQGLLRFPQEQRESFPHAPPRTCDNQITAWCRGLGERNATHSAEAHLFCKGTLPRTAPPCANSQPVLHSDRAPPPSKGDRNVTCSVYCVH